MFVRINCPGCRNGFNLDESQCGQTIRCPQCGKPLMVGKPATRPATPPPPPPKQSAPPQHEPIVLTLLDDPKPSRPAPPPSPSRPSRETSPDDFDLGTLSSPPVDGKSEQVQTAPSKAPPRPAPPPSRGGATSKDDFDVPTRPSSKGSDTRPAPREEGNRTPLILGAVFGGIVLVIMVVIILVSVQGDVKEDHTRRVSADKVERPRPNEVKPKDRLPTDRVEPDKGKDVRPPDDRVPVKDEKPIKIAPVEPPPDALPEGAVRVVGPLKEMPPELKAPTLTAESEVRKLPGYVTDVVVGGDGRYLILLLGQERQIALFDVNEAKVAGMIPVPSAEVRVAAGLTKLIVFDPPMKTAERWDLATRRKEQSAKLVLSGKTGNIYMGSASNGPLLVTSMDDSFGRRGTLNLFDPSTFGPVIPTSARQSFQGTRLPDLAAHLVRVAPNGRLFAARESVGGEPHRMRAFFLDGERLEMTEKWDIASSLAIPSADNRFLYTASGVYSSSFDLVRRHPNANTNPRTISTPMVPAQHGDYHMVLEPDRNPQRFDENGDGSVSFYVADLPKPVGRISGLNGIYSERLGYGGSGKRGLLHDQRVFYSPVAKLLVTIPTSGDKLVLHRFDIEEALVKSGQDYLVVTSVPPRVARKGKAFVHPVRVMASSGKVSYQLTTGPEGMKLSADGVLQWDVPGKPEKAEVDVTLRVDADKGREAYQSFRLSLIE